MSIDDELFQKWMYASESDSLDFKRDQYEFIGATDAEKSELLKDILAMTNSWCESDAYIVIGIEDLPVKPNALHGISDHIDDAIIQQFVNGKTAAVCRFEYISHTDQGFSYGVLRIPRQARPAYLKRSYGGLKANTVYVRRGSSTDEASPAEIALMGKEVNDSREANLMVELYDTQNGLSLGSSISVTTKEILITDNIPDYKASSTGGMFSVSLGMENKNYYREMIEHINFRLAYIPLDFCIENTGDLEAVNIRIEMEFPPVVYGLLTDGDEVDAPDSNMLNVISRLSPSTPSGFLVDSYSDRWLAGTHLERLHAKRRMDIGGRLYLKVKESANVTGKIRVFYDGQSRPDEMEINIEVEHSLAEGPWGSVRSMIE